MSPARFLRPSRRGAATLAFCLGALPLAACGEFAAGAGQGAESAAGTKEAAASPAASGAPAVSPELVAAPAVFEATGSARWDGRRTLQGVWVAHPQASTARRVRIYNAATGAAADGALFTRDAVLSGPSMLVSSDAASLLGLAPGEETELRVVAVTPRAAGGGEALAAAPAASPATGSPAPATPAGAARAAPPRAVAETGTSVAGTTTPPEAARAAPLEPTPPSRGADRAAEPAVGRASPGPSRPRPTRARAGPAPAGIEPARQATPPTVQAEVESEPAPEGEAMPRAPTPQAAPADVATARPGSGAPARDTAQAAAGPAVDAAPAAAVLAQPYVQAGLFAVEGNAEHLIRRIEGEGLPAVGKPVRLATGPATRVLAGPFATAAERDAARRRIQAMGLPDAIPVAR